MHRSTKEQTSQVAIDKFLASGHTITRCPTMAANGYKLKEKLSASDLELLRTQQRELRDTGKFNIQATPQTDQHAA